MNKSYDVYMCRERKQVFRAPINSRDTFGYIPPMQQMIDGCLYHSGSGKAGKVFRHYEKTELDMHMAPVKNKISWKTVFIYAMVLGLILVVLMH